MGPISRLQCPLKALPLGLFLHESESILREIIPHRQVLEHSELVALLGRESPRLPRSKLDLSVLEVLRSSPDVPRQADVRLSKLLQGRCGSVKLKSRTKPEVTRTSVSSHSGGGSQRKNR